MAMSPMNNESVTNHTNAECFHDIILGQLVKPKRDVSQYY